MFENLTRFFKKMSKSEPKELEATTKDSKETAKERLHMVLMQDRANVSADFLELMKQEIIDVIKKYIEVNEDNIDVRLITQKNEDGSNGTPSLYANIPILNIRNDMKVENYKFALQSDGSIIAQKIEEPKENEEQDTDKIEVEDNNKEINQDNENNNTEKITEDNENNNTEKITEDNESNNTEKINEDIQNKSAENTQKIEQRQNDIIKEIIPAISNIKKMEELKEAGIEINIDKKNNNIVDEKTEKVKEVITETVVQLKKSAKRGRPKKKDKKIEEKVAKEQVKKENLSDEEDDDVTFDDLLKAAEEEDRKNAEQKKKRFSNEK